ncbi:hypothetical protein L1049_026568 [Liquidambar formosana]|uniref:Uncharacterized protein n=1 Tax=Liquidambar formosana TaxID=63359 RepID=A0AAP0NFT1_LIQFO
MEDSKALHVVVFPWLAMGHIIPFFHLSEHLAQKGHKVSFVSTPRNLQRLPKIPQNLSYLLTVVSLPLPHVEALPPHAESSTDIPPKQAPFLKKAFDLLELPLKNFLENTAPDWIIYDYASHWLPPLAAKLGISRAYFGPFTAASLAFVVPPASEMDGGDLRLKPEDFTVVPKWVPFESNVKYHLHELLAVADDSLSGIESGTSDTVRFAVSIGESDVVGIRSCVEFEPEWFNLLEVIHRKPVLPVGFLPQLVEEGGDEIDERWVGIKEWLDKQRLESVVYVALGSEATLSREQLTELALGLEQSELPFFWVLRKLPWSNQDALEMLPDGFEERVEGRGMVYVGWAPQVKILSHKSVGGFLTHCGWNSVIEGLGSGRVLILFPVLNDQGLNARLLHGKKLGVEIARNELDGSFTHDSVAKSVKLAVVEEEGESLRATAKEMKCLFGDTNRNDRHIDAFIRHLEENRRSPR